MQLYTNIETALKPTRIMTIRQDERYISGNKWYRAETVKDFKQYYCV